MAQPHQALKIYLYEDKSATALEAELSGRFTRLVFSTALHGGFKQCDLTVPMDLGEAWQWLNRENLPGRHYHHLVLSEGGRTVWEGRVMDVELAWNAAFSGLSITAMGYWSSLRDRLYKAGTGDATDWTIGGPHVASDVIKQMIVQQCPDINGTAGIQTNSRNIAGINLGTYAYPQDVIVSKLAPLADSDGGVYHFAVWEGRQPHWKPRSVARVDWYLFLKDVSQGRLRQQGIHLRNGVIPYMGTAEGTGTIDSGSTATYPLRQILLNLGTGLPATAGNDARDAAIADGKSPTQDQDFTVKGHVYSTQAAVMGTGTAAGTAVGQSGALVERPKWWVRAGDVVRINDLLPASVATASLDNLRTFYVLETRYDAVADTLSVQPDRPPGRLGVLLSRIGTIELPQ